MRITVPTIPLSPLGNPKALPTAVEIQTAVGRITDFLRPKNALIVTGAGVSVDSGIRAYRGEDGRYMNPNYKPIFYQELIDDSAKGHAFRQRYWSRSYLGYPPVRDAQPNPTHYSIAALQYMDHAPRIITQNVDRLHHKASPFPDNHRHILELHGSLHTVHCRNKHAIPRDIYQDMISARNPSWQAFADEMEKSGTQPRTNPDGDVDIRGVKFDDFVVPECPTCSSEGRTETVMKPEVVFFGESIPDIVKARSFKLVEESNQVLFIGTTLATYSAFRLLKHALELRKSVMMLNLGPTRADGIAGMDKIELASGDVLPEVCRELGGSHITSDPTLARLLSSGVVKPPEERDDDRSPRATG